jgi:hypothetical protein
MTRRARQNKADTEARRLAAAQVVLAQRAWNDLAHQVDRVITANGFKPPDQPRTPETTKAIDIAIKDCERAFECDLAASFAR